MTFVETVLAFLLISCTGSSKPDDDIPEFHAAVLNAYDASKSLSENFYTIVEAMCPNSAYCEKPVTSELGKVVDMNEDTSNSSLIPRALDFLRNKSSSLTGCCTRCSCGGDCIEKNNCCPTMNTTMLKNDEITEPEVTQECVAASIRSYIPGAGLSRSDYMSLGYYMVTDCFDKTANESLANKCKHPNASHPVEITPAYSFVSGRNYKNRFCAECNGDYNVIPWQMVIIFNEYLSLTGKNPIPTSAMALFRLLKVGKKNTLIYDPPHVVNILTHKCLIPSPEKYRIRGSDYCVNFSFLSDSQNLFLKQACEFQVLRFQTIINSLDNVFCAVCGNDVVTYNDDTLNDCNNMQRLFSYSFSAVLYFDQTQTESMNEPIEDDNEVICKCTEFHDTERGICRQLVCPVGEHFVNCRCQPFLTHITGMTIMVYLDIVPKTRGSYATEPVNFIGDMGKRRAIRLVSAIVHVLNSRWGPLSLDRSLLYRETSYSDEYYFKFYNVITMKMKHETDNRRVMRRIFNGLHIGLTATILNVPVKISLGRVLKLVTINSTTTMVLFNDRDVSDVKRELLISEQIEPELLIPMKTFYQPLSKTIFCRRVKLETSEAEMLHNGSMASVTPIYLGYVFNEKDNSMCLEEFVSFFIQSGSIENHQCCMYALIAAYCSWMFAHIP